MLKQCTKGAKKNFEELCQVYNGAVTDAEMLQLLSALQIAFAYAKFFAPESFNSGGFVSVSRPDPNSLDKDLRIDEISILAASTSVEKPEEVGKYQTVLAEATQYWPLSTALQQVSDIKGADSANSKELCEWTKFSGKSIKQLEKTLRESVPNPPFKNWSEKAATWIVHLLSSLHGAKHEGGALEFTFIMGDMAQIEDSSALELLILDDAGFDFPPQEGLDEEEKIMALKDAKKIIEKENYFWFQGGRYALLWDFTSPEKQPRHLLGLNDSSWHVFIANARNRKKPTTAKAALVVGYLDDRGGGGLIVDGNHIFSLTQGGKWIQRGDALSKRVEDYLRAAGKDVLTDKEINSLVKAVIAVSNDPELGCMLIVSNSGHCPEFETMGHPWKVSRTKQAVTSDVNSERLFDLPDELLVAMLGMDGSACVWKESGECRIAFRKLARPPASLENARNEFSGAKQELSGEGSRKWSAYLAATRNDVDLIVAVSQDGPVHFYAPLNIAKEAYSDNVSEKSFNNAADEDVIHDMIS